MSEHEVSTSGLLSNNHSTVAVVALAVTVMTSNAPAKTDMVNIGGTDSHSEPMESTAALQSAIIRGARSLSASINQEGEARLDRLLATHVATPHKSKITKVR